MNWVLVRDIGNSWPAKASILMPFVGYIIVTSDYITKNLFGISNSASGAVNYLHFFILGQSLWALHPSYTNSDVRAL